MPIGEGRPASGINVVTDQGYESYLLPISRQSTYDKAFFEPLYFQFLPSITSDSDGATFEAVGGEGRAEPFHIYKSGDGRTIALTTQFAAIDERYNCEWVQRQVMRLKSFLKPIYDREDIINNTGSRFYAPPLILFSYGWLFVNVPVVLTSVEVATAEGAALGKYALPTVVDVTFTLKTNYPFGYVPGYINFWKMWQNPLARSGQKRSFGEMSFGGSSSTGDERNLADQNLQIVEV